MNTPANTLAFLLIFGLIVIGMITMIGLIINATKNTSETSDNNPLANMSDSELANYGIAQARSKKLAMEKMEKMERELASKIAEIEELKKYI